MSRHSDEALEVLRGIWTAQGQTSVDPGESGTTKSCKKMSAVGFDAMAAEADGDLRSAWRAQLAREGKLNADGGSVADLVLRPGPAR
ncbi:MAG: hypothetical protein ACLQDY_02355 [Streptosporangiaceae bacterium]